MMEELKEFSRVGQKPRKKERGHHCEKRLYDNSMPGFYAARPVKRNDYIHDGDAMATYWKEWKNLEKREVWRWETLCEWDDVNKPANINCASKSNREAIAFTVISQSFFRNIAS